MVSIKDIAAAAQVTPGTVSKVLNGKETAVRISTRTAQRIREAAQALGYQPNRAAQALSMGKTMQIALWVPHLMEPYYAEMVHYANGCLQRSGYDMLVSDAAVTGDWQSHLARMSNLTVDGILACDSPVYIRAYLGQRGPRRMPIVGFGSGMSAVVGMADVVRLDLRGGMLAVLEHLVGQGRRSLLYISPGQSATADDERYSAFVDFCAHGDCAWEILKLADYSPETARVAARAYLSRAHRPDALVCFSDDVALGVHRAVMELGIRMPEEMSLVGHSGIRDCQFLSPRLSTVNHPGEQMCERAWSILQSRLDSPDCPFVTETLAVELMVSESSQRGGSE